MSSANFDDVSKSKQQIAASSLLLNRTASNTQDLGQDLSKDVTYLSPQVPPKKQKATSKQKAASVLPLPLVTFERYMLFDERPNYPMTYVVVADLQGEADRTALEESFCEALHRHPLLTAHIERRRGKLYWVQTNPSSQNNSAHLAGLRWFEDNQPRIPVGEEIDLFQSPGVRLEAVVDQDKTSLRFIFHHAVCDGIGGLRFLGDVLALYGQKTSETPDAPYLLPLDSESLRHRGILERRLDSSLSRWQKNWNLAYESWGYLTTMPKPLQIDNRPDPETRGQLPTLPVVTISEEMNDTYARVANQQGATANDLFLRDFFLTLHQWSQAQKKYNGKSWICVTAPTSMRRRRESRMPAANMLGYALLSRRLADCDRSAEFLASIVQEMDDTRKQGLGSLFIDALSLVDKIPCLLSLGSRPPVCFTTAVFSNVGDLLRRFRARFPKRGKNIVAGNLMLESIYGAPPVRPGTRFSVAGLNYAGNMRLALRYDPQWLTQEHAQVLLDNFQQHIEKSSTAVCETA